MDGPLNWLRLTLCISLVLGLPGCSSQKTSIDSHLDLLVKGVSFSRRNIGLAGGVPKVRENISLSDVPDPSITRGVLHQMFQGAWAGALSGLETGQLFCWGSSGSGRRTLHISGKSGGADALVFIILCGGGMVTGFSIGAAVGMVTPFVSSKHSDEILFARQHVIRGVWKKLTTTKGRESGHQHHTGGSIDERLPGHRITFGSKVQPYTAFVRFTRIRVGLFPKSYFTDELTLVWDINVELLDRGRRVVAKQTIEMEQGEYSFEEWADQGAFFLKEKLQEGYGLIADEIVRKLTQPALSS